ncbi:MAG: hypothetical protein EPO26_03805 [Chloroflexota bacterium]|nr:MAG: hypothetical protein EPO26_03805 [Chloroflexota bacterium]
MAIASERVTADVIEANEFADLSDRYAVQGVPKIVINDRRQIVGSRPEAAFLAEVLAAVE